MKVHNFIEVEVDKLLPNLLEKYTGMCKCQKCVADIKAITLNNLIPHYVASEKGELYTKLLEFDSQTEVDIYKELIKAINIVKGRPQHE